MEEEEKNKGETKTKETKERSCRVGGIAMVGKPYFLFLLLLLGTGGNQAIHSLFHPTELSVKGPVPQSR